MIYEFQVNAHLILTSFLSVIVNWNAIIVSYRDSSTVSTQYILIDIIWTLCTSQMCFCFVLLKHIDISSLKEWIVNIWWFPLSHVVENIINVWLVCSHFSLWYSSHLWQCVLPVLIFFLPKPFMKVWFASFHFILSLETLCISVTCKLPHVSYQLLIALFIYISQCLMWRLTVRKGYKIYKI